MYWIIGRFRGGQGAWPKIFGNKNAIKSEFLPPPPPSRNFEAGGPEKFFLKNHFF